VGKKLKKVLELIYDVEILTGLHIGAGGTEERIGGIDNPVVKNPLDGEPYIPGSSLKGKMRSLLELKYGWSKDGKPADLSVLKDGSDEKLKSFLKLFGVSAGDKDGKNMKEIAPTRIIVEDFMPVNYKLEEKTEVSIDRITGTVSGAGPRIMERVAAGSVFRGKILVKVFEGDDEKSLLSLVDEGLKLVESDYLGGSGSRGYGRVRFSKVNESVVVE